MGLQTERARQLLAGGFRIGRKDPVQRRKTYQQLTREQRHTIQTMRQAGSNRSVIAKAIGVHASTVGRELKRNGSAKGYQWRRAQRRSEERRRLARKATKLTPQVVEFLMARLAEGWTPESVALFLGQSGVSARWYYRLIELDRQAGGRLYEYLPFGRRRTRRCKWRRQGPIPQRRDISERPMGAQRRSQFGHWEADLIEGTGHRSHLLTLRERKSRFWLQMRVPDKTTATVVSAIIYKLRPFRRSFKTLTVDNGGEFAEHARISAAMARPASVFFTRPYRAADKASIEQGNGVVRHRHPKGTDFASVPLGELEESERRMNLRPMRVLKGKCPAHFINELLGQAG